MTGPSKTSIEVLETVLRLEQDRKDDAIADILSASKEDLERMLAEAGISAAEVEEIVRGSLQMPSEASPDAEAPTGGVEAANAAEGFKSAGWKVAPGRAGTSRRRGKPDRRQGGTSAGAADPVRATAGVRLAANEFGKTEAPSALGNPYRDDVVIAGRTYAAYVDVSEKNEVILKGHFEDTWSQILLFGKEAHLLERVAGHDDARKCVGVGRLLLRDALKAQQNDPDGSAIVIK